MPITQIHLLNELIRSYRESYQQYLIPLYDTGPWHFLVGLKVYNALAMVVSLKNTGYP